MQMFLCKLILLLLLELWKMSITHLINKITLFQIYKRKTICCLISKIHFPSTDY